jgi:ribosome recycling factor
MTEDIKMIIDMSKESMAKSLEHLNEALSQIRAGKADPRTLNGVMVDYYGTDTPLNQVCSINTPDARTIKIQPWEKTLIEAIEKAILSANLGLNPSNNGESILINVPALTEERRKDLVKQAKQEGEKAKISIRNIRKEAIDQFRALKKDGLSEDLEKDAEIEAQNITDSFTKKVDDLVKQKEVDIMTI